MPSTGVLLIQLGTPDAPTTPALRRYLRQFLGDPRVIEVPRPRGGSSSNFLTPPFAPPALPPPIGRPRGAPPQVVVHPQLLHPPVAPVALRGQVSPYLE